MSDYDELKARLRPDEVVCPFCGRDPYHYVDIGVGYQAAAVNCCDLGVGLFQHGDEQLIKELSLRSEAADAITALQARVAELEAEELALRADLRSYMDAANQYARDAEAAEAALAEARSVQAAAKVLLDAWDGTDKDAFHRVVVASSFGAQAFAVVPHPDAKAGAMFRALMQAVINPDDTELDWLRAKNAIRALAEGDSA